MEILEVILHSFIHAVKDSLIVIPFMYLAYLLIGVLERGGGAFMLRAIVGANKVGPLIGGAIGAAPSCGFSAAASNLYSSGLLTAGTLISVYLSTSDEMLAVMIGKGVAPLEILKILGIKVIIAIIAGFALDFVIRLYYRIRYKAEYEAEDGEEYDGNMECECGDSCCAAGGMNLFLAALLRTLRVLLFIVIVSFIINVVFEIYDINVWAAALQKMPVVGCLVAALVGLIPNCAVSVAVTTLYLNGVIGAPIMMTALLAGAGSGLLVLWRANRNMAENLYLTVSLYVISVIFGSISGIILF